MTLQVGIIGTGWFADKHAHLLSQQEGVKVTAIAASSQQKADQFASTFNDAKGYSNIEDMLDAGKLDAVYICTPPFAHGHFEQALIERNIPFLVEKPLSSEAELPMQLLQKIEAKQLITSVGYHFRYMDSADKAKQLLADRNIAMSLGYWMGGAPGGTWWRRQELSGGQFVEQTTHIVDLLRYLVGEVTEVYATYSEGILAKQDSNANVADAGTVTLKLSNGTIATISNTCIIPAGYESGLHVYTDAGKLEIGHGGLKDITTASTTEYHNQSNPYENEAKAFLHAIRTGDVSLIRSNYADAYRTHQVTMAANESASTGKVIKLG
ncbi:Gfo/Idh/MocA family protein [Paenibacillus endoradicis]|uniref:Gfo/Idh/MocA family protein n=1 Tax=Paenibacillus endoradicis TaxID=2972487 RepID=UPI0021594847|nr:Gfo/Idh/MocA family oxidoreductase [Paenibacillus endoradicis]MCR8657316.1 Gfo/Idh/MocA family oxidoreductase [Paenibacillus endoradicis]